MPKKDFLLEIGLEEIPAGYILPAMSKMQVYFTEKLTEAKLEFEEIKPFSTPRRFAIKITGLQTAQEDEIIERVGPAKMAAYDADGNLSKAAMGFLRGAGAKPEDIYLKETPKGKKIAVKKEVKGQQTEDILKALIAEIIPKLNFPKSMKWGKTKMSFARPIRWVLALFGDFVLALKVNGLTAGRISYGNRFQQLENPIEISVIDEYESSLKSVFVIPDRQLRKLLIEDQLQNLFKQGEYQVVKDSGLLEVVTDLVEFPKAVVADFAPKYLDLPQKVIISTLSQHQKYFAVKDYEGNIVNKFVFIANGDPKFSDLIKLGNEKVITARLEDAEFFYREDTSVPLEQFVDKLAEVTFQQDLGTLLEKTQRIEMNVSYILEKLAIGSNEAEAASRAAILCKADLVTQMLGEKEFTKLQGYMGMIYARESGESELVSRAIYEHYLPRGERDELPVSQAGAVVALADKLDTVCGIIAVNMIPTGSKDPFALRRAANGIVQIIDAFEFEFDIFDLIDFAFQNLQAKLPDPENNKETVYDFFRQRVNWLLKQKKIDYDVIDSVLHIDPNNIPDLIHRAGALQKFKGQADFIKLVLAFKRVSNIIESADKQVVDENLIQHEMEKKLYDNYQLLETEIEKLLPVKDYDEILKSLVKFGKTIDDFFDDVLVNVEDEKTKQNRYNILFCIRNLFLQVADLSKLVVEGN